MAWLGAISPFSYPWGPRTVGDSYTFCVPSSNVSSIGLFGGTFDPPHLGHLAAAKAVREVLGLDRVALMVANDPWQKSSDRVVTPAEVRLEMVRALVAGEEGLVADDREIRRGGPTYTIDTLEELALSQPGAAIYLVVGQDTAATIAGTWHRGPEVLAAATLVVVARAGEPSRRGGLPSGSMFVEMKPVDVSSSQVRDAVSRGDGVGHLTGDAVARLIERHGLYRDRA